jgi:hypothetical protein
MMFRALREQCRDEYEFLVRQRDLGLDARMQLDDLPVRFAPEVHVREWVEPGDPPILTRVYETPAGTLTSAIKQLEGWPYGDRLPLFSDYITPRAVIRPVTEPAHLPALRCLLTAPAVEDKEAFLAEARRRKAFAGEHGVALAGGWRGVRAAAGEDRLLVGENFGTVSVIDTLMWLCGGSDPMLWAYDAPEFLHELITILEEWNLARLAVHLEAGPDLVFRRAWYEGTDFWSPPLYRKFILPGLRREVELAHQAGARHAYIISTGMAAIAPLIIEAGVDAVVGVDPGQGRGTDLEQVRQTMGGKVALWGGVNGPLVVEEGTEGDVRRAVEEAFHALGDSGRFILSPVDNVRVDSERSRRNVRAFIATWRALTAV